MKVKTSKLKVLYSSLLSIIPFHEGFAIFIFLWYSLDIFAPQLSHDAVWSSHAVRLAASSTSSPFSSNQAQFSRRQLFFTHRSI